MTLIIGSILAFLLIRNFSHELTNPSEADLHLESTTPNPAQPTPFSQPENGNKQTHKETKSITHIADEGDKPSFDPLTPSSELTTDSRDSLNTYKMLEESLISFEYKAVDTNSAWALVASEDKFMEAFYMINEEFYGDPQAQSKADDLLEILHTNPSIASGLVNIESVACSKTLCLTSFLYGNHTDYLEFANNSINRGEPNKNFRFNIPGYIEGNTRQFMLFSADPAITGGFTKIDH